MRKDTRKQFLRSALSFFSAMLATLLFPGIAGCRRRESPPGKALKHDTAPAERKRGTARIDQDFEPSYLALHKSGELKKRGQKLWNIMEECRLCPRLCAVNRLKGERGYCQSHSGLKIASYNPHFGEERSLVGNGGSGTIFFSHCGLRCVFCINWEISHSGMGAPASLEDMAAMMLRLQGMGCHNINIVTPTHYSPHILMSLDIAAKRGLRLPLVYNTCGWELPEILELLDGVVDIYLPDFKYSDRTMASRYSPGAGSYPDVTKRALLEMHRQVGTARPARDGLMYRGLMIRHLVMPNRVSGSREIFRWIALNLPRDTYVNIMSQYRPVHRAGEFPKISRPITRSEFKEAVAWARKAGLSNLDIQEYPLF